MENHSKWVMNALQTIYSVLINVLSITAMKRTRPQCSYTAKRVGKKQVYNQYIWFKDHLLLCSCEPVDEESSPIGYRACLLRHLFATKAIQYTMQCDGHTSHSQPCNVSHCIRSGGGSERVKTGLGGVGLQVPDQHRKFVDGGCLHLPLIMAEAHIQIGIHKEHQPNQELHSMWRLKCATIN